MGGGAGLRWRDVGDDGVGKRSGDSPMEAGEVADVEGEGEKMGMGLLLSNTRKGEGR